MGIHMGSREGVWQLFWVFLSGLYVRIFFWKNRPQSERRQPWRGSRNQITAGRRLQAIETAADFWSHATKSPLLTTCVKQNQKRRDIGVVAKTSVMACWKVETFKNVKRVIPIRSNINEKRL
jgi:hypothetical protein